MRSFENPGELDKALLDGSFEDTEHLKPELPEIDDRPELSLSSEERQRMTGSTRLLEVAQQFDKMLTETQEKGLGGALSRALAERADFYRGETIDAQGRDSEILEGIIQRANTELENFQASLRRHEEAKQAERVGTARSEVAEAFETIEEIVPEQPKIERAPLVSEAVEMPYLHGSIGIVEAFKDLGTEAKGKSKYAQKASTMLVKYFGREFKKIEKMDKNRTTLEERNDARQQLRQEAEEQWQKLRNAIDMNM